jgi:hypothetical protein
MGKTEKKDAHHTEAKGGHHAEHHADHHVEHHETNETVDYTKFDPKFTNTVESVGPVWGDFHHRRQ